MCFPRARQTVRGSEPRHHSNVGQRRVAAPERLHSFDIDPKHCAEPTRVGTPGMREHGALDADKGDLTLGVGRLAVTVEKAA